MSQCVSCNNQPNDNDSLGGAAHEGTVTPMVIGIIVGTVAVFVLVLCALFYCAKLENDKTRRLKVVDPADVGPDVPLPSVEGGGAVPDDRGGDVYSSRDHGDFGAKSGSIDRRPSSITMVAREGEDARAGAGWRVPAGAVVGRKKGLFGWGGKKCSGRATPADNPPVTAIEMV
ncbi:hypothetical protein Daus18300_008374 [Diaporthe australafricana]|uniref:Uncharacterized protein n=1 Tax=Diaporthe australafricana TaxID=127596 RepID=A0ABR3WIQ4_9PEZI